MTAEDIPRITQSEYRKDPTGVARQYPNFFIVSDKDPDRIVMIVMTQTKQLGCDCDVRRKTLEECIGLVNQYATRDQLRERLYELLRLSEQP